jgi:hypothetical protein
METVTIRRQSLVGFAIGVVVTLIATLVIVYASRADAAPGDADSTFVPMTPCRLIDTRRAPDRVGTIGTFSANDTRPVAAHGTNGECTIPSDSVGLSLNVTALNATAPTFVAVWPEGKRPTVSSLNPTPGQPPTPNAVTTALSASGQFNVYNLAGDLDLIVDVNGYYIRASLQEIGGRLAAAESKVAALATSTAALQAAQPFVVTNTETTDLGSQVTATPVAYASVELTAPVAGQVTVHSTAHVDTFTSNAELICAIFESTNIPSPNISRATPSYQYWMALNSSNQDTISGTRVFDIAANETITYSLACEFALNGPLIQTRSVTATFTPAP